MKGAWDTKGTVEMGIPKPPAWKIGDRNLYNNLKHSHTPHGQAHAIPGTYDMQQAIVELPEQDHVAASWLAKAIASTHRSSSVRTIMTYIKSDAASNLTPHEKAQLWLACLDKLKYLGVLRGFFE